MFESIKPILDTVVFGNTVNDYLISLIIFLSLLILAIIIHRVGLKKLKSLAQQTSASVDDFIVSLMEKKILPLLYLGTFFIAIQNLKLGKSISNVFNFTFIILFSIFIISFVTSLVRYLLESYWIKKETDPTRLRTLKGLLPAINTIVWGIGIVFLLNNLGFNISAVIAGLGIGGVAVALAGQAILADLFSYFSILLDRPFEIGDFIVIDDYKGSIEHIGLKTTRIRSLSGEQLIFSNTDLTSSRVRNYKRMEQRRILFKIGVVYNTPIEKIKEIPQIIEKIIKDSPDTKFDRVHFASYGDFSLDYEIVYYVLSDDYTKYMDIQQKINFAIYEEFKLQQIEFAYPTQVLYVYKN